MSGTVITTVRYARADSEALLTEKAYLLNYPTPAHIPRTNFVIDYYPGVKIRDLRTASLSYCENGITMAKLPACMAKEDFDDEGKIERVYLPQVHSCIQKTLGVKEVYIFDYMVRKREPAFPYQPATKDNAPQPALSAHIGRSRYSKSDLPRSNNLSQDYTTDEIKGRVEKYFKDRAEEFGRRWFQIIK